MICFPIMIKLEDLKRKSPTLIIDSEALDNADQVNSDFKKIFDSEIEEFKRDYARINGQGAAENITDAEILREVVNTVGEPGKLGCTYSMCSFRLYVN